MPLLSTEQPDPTAGNTPSIFAEHLRYVLDREIERSARTTSRAETIFRSQVALLTVAVSIAAFLYRDGRGPKLFHPTVGILAFAILVAVGSLLAAAFAQSIATRTTGTSEESIEMMLSPEHWHDDPDALYVTACRDKDSIRALRTSNGSRGYTADWALWLQTSSIVFAVVGVSYEAARRIGWI